MKVHNTELDLVNFSIQVLAYIENHFCTDGNGTIYWPSADRWIAKADVTTLKRAAHKALAEIFEEQGDTQYFPLSMEEAHEFTEFPEVYFKVAEIFFDEAGEK